MLHCGEAQSQTNASLLAIGSLSFGEVSAERSEDEFCGKVYIQLRVIKKY